MKIKWGALVTDGRNKIGGHVASKNRGGAYLRTKVTPSNPQTSFQTAVRQRLAGFSQSFRDLTASQILAWNVAVANFKTTDIFGDLKNPSGINLYVKLNSNLEEVGAAAIVDPPLPAEVIGPLTISVIGDESASTLALTFTATPIAADMKWIVRATPQLSPGISFAKNQLRNLSILASGATSPQALGAAYEAKFGNLVAGQKIFVEIIAVNTVTGQKSPALSTSTIVVA